jgi:transcriptional regulator with XRE-family HTH domain
MNLSEKLLKLRKVHGFSQDDLADKLGITRQSISKWESNQVTPELEKIVKLAELFGTSTDYLLHPSATDELMFTTSILEKQQENIARQQTLVQNRQFLIISILLAALAAAVVFILGKYVMFPDYQEGHAMLGKTVIIYGGTLVIIGATVFINWKFREKQNHRL